MRLKNTLPLFAFFLLCQIWLPAQVQVQLGSGTDVTGDQTPSPVNIWYESLRGQIVYTAAELNAAGVYCGTIQKLGFYIEEAPSHNLPNYSIKMKHTSAVNAATHDFGPYTEVYLNPSYAPTIGGFDLLVLNTPFFWNGFDNILIDVCFDQVPNYTSTGTVRYYSETNGFRYVRQDDTDVCGFETNSTQTQKPQILIEFQPFAPNDAGVISVDSPTVFCPGNHNIVATIVNYGTDTIFNVDVNWQFNGVLQTPINYNVPMDTCGSNNNMATITLGNKTFAANQNYDIKVWTSNPNGVTDPVNVNDTISVNVSAGLSGTFTIGGTTPDFNTFGEAVAALEANGVCDSVKFNVRNGTYNEQISIGEIPGADPLRHITFQSETGDSSLVILTFSASSSANYTLLLNGADWVTFKKMTIEATDTNYGRAVEITGGANHNRFLNNLIKGIANSSTSTNYANIYSPSNFVNEHNVFRNNHFLNGSYGLFSEGNYNNANYVAGTEIKNNFFENQYCQGIYLYRHDSLLVTQNTLQSNTTYSNYYGIYMYDHIGGGQVTFNQVKGINSGDYGIYLSSLVGDASHQWLIANNYVQMGGSNVAYGLYTEYGDYQNILYNTVHLTNTNSSSRVFYNVAGFNKLLLNNNFVNSGGGYAIYLSNTSAFSISDYNNFFSSGPIMGYWNVNRATLADWQAATSLDAQSISEDPDFVDTLNFHVTAIELNGAAFPSPLVTTDLDGQARNATTPDIGADEFTPPANDAELETFTNPISPFVGGVQPAKVILKNNGGNALASTVIGWQVNGAAQSPFNWSGSLAPADVDTVTVGNFTFNSGTVYDLTAWSSLPNGMADANTANDTITATGLEVAMAGVYTIGGTSPDFATFTLAVAALHQRGVSDTVTFNVRNGTYTEQIVINEIVGAGSLSPITFQSESGDSSMVTLTFSANSSANYTLGLNGADWLRFHKITIQATNTTYGTAVVITGSANHNTWSHCLLKGVATTSTSTNRNVVYAYNGFSDEYNVFENNRIQNGSYGIYYDGIFDTTYTEGIVVQGNVFENQYYMGLYLQEMQASIVDGNTVFTNSTYSNYYGLYLTNFEGSTIVTKNKVYGLSFGGYGIYMYDLIGSLGNECLIANNFVQIGGSVNEAWGIVNYYGNLHNILHNTVHITNTNSNSRAFYNYFGNDKIFLNNILANTGGGQVIEGYFGFIASDNNDLFTNGPLFGIWGNISHITFADWQTGTGFDANSISADPYFVATGNFAVTAVELNGAASPNTLVTTDIEGDLRNATTPDIGADEFTPPTVDAALLSFANPVTPFAPGTQNVQVVLKNNGTATLTSTTLHWEINGAVQTPFSWTGSLGSGNQTTVSLGSPSLSAGTMYDLRAWSSNPNGAPDPFPANDTTEVNNLVAGLAGVYTIGGASPDFVSFNAAVSALHTGGVVGAVTFNVRNGTYTEQVFIQQIAGADSLKTVTFQSESGDSTQVILTNAATSSTFNYTLLLTSADWVTIRKMTIRATGASFGRVVDFGFGAHHNVFENNVFQGVAINSTSNNFAVFFSGGYTDNYNIIRNNRFVNGTQGIQIFGTSTSDRETGNIVEGNIFVNQYARGLNLINQNSPIIRGNTITTTSTYTSYNGIVAYLCYSGQQTTGNSVFLNNGTIGIAIDNCYGTATERGITANNFVQVGGSQTTNGIYLASASYQNVYHNSVHLNATTTASRAFYNTSGNNNQVRNNIFHSSTGGYAYYTASTSAILVSDHNDLFTTGTNLGFWGANRINLAAWQTASGKDANSVSVDPTFVSATDLHTNNVVLNNAGTPVAEVSTDFDGDTRDPATPDIGADEFSTSNEDAGVTSIDAPVMPFAAGMQAVSVTIFNNGLDTLESVTVNWEVNGVAQTPLPWMGSLLSGESEDSLTLGTFIFEVDTLYTLSAWTSNPNGIVDTLNLNDTATVTNLYAALSGVYTIGGTAPDFLDFQAAVTAMTNGGVVGAVTFNVRDGVYTEQISIPQINGASATNTVTFQSESGDSTAVTLQFGSTLSTANYTLRLDGADWFRFKKMSFKATTTTYTRVVQLLNGANDNRFENNEITGHSVTSTSAQYALVFSDGSVDNNNVFLHNRLVSGTIGFYLWGTSGTYEIGTVIEGNRLENQYYAGIYLTYQNAPQVVRNEITTTAVNLSYIAIYGSSCSNASVITYNYIHDIAAGHGIQLSGSNGTSGLRGLVANNFVSLGNNSGNDGLAIYLTSCNFQNIYHNNVHYSSSDDNNTYGLYLNSSSNINVKNNVVALSNLGRAFYKTSGSNVFSDHNDLYAANGANLGYWNGTNVADLAAWQTASGQDAHSVSIDPIFTSASDLHVAELDLNNTGTPVTQVIDDFDGDPRSPTTPDIGADEFSPIVLDDASVVEIVSPNKNVPFPSGVRPVEVTIKNNGANVLTTVTVQWQANGLQQAAYHWSGSLMPGARDTVAIGNHNFSPGFGHDLLAYTQLPNGMNDNNPSNDDAEALNLYGGLLGAYTIGGAFPDFPSFTAAANSLNNGGVLGPVTFLVRNGNYDEQISLDQINGASFTNNIVFQSQNGDSSLVKLRNQNCCSPDYVVRLNGADFVTFRKMTFETTGCCVASMFEFTNGANFNNLQNCRFLAPVGNTNPIIVSNSSFLDNNNTIENNRIENGRYGIYFYGQSSSQLESDNIVRNNTIINPQYDGILMYYQNSPIIESNAIATSSTYNSFEGIHCGYCDNSLRVLNNRVLSESGTGIRLTYCDAQVSARGLTANNFVKVGGTVTAYGIYSYYSNFQNFYYNSTHLTNTSASSRALYSYFGANLNYLNNIYANSGGGYAAYINGSGVASSNFNDFYTTGPVLGYFNGDRANLAAWQSATGKDLNSVAVNPLFYSDEDLHVLQVALDGAATVIAGITTDFDGQPRHASLPDIGADEFNYVTDDLGVAAMLTPVENCNLGSTAQVKVRIQNYGGLPQTGFNITYRLNNGAPVTENVGALNVPPGGTADYTFLATANISAYAAHEFVFYSQLVGDLNHANDSLSTTVQNFQTPGLVGNMLPANGSVNIDPPINFSWLPAAGATRYDLYVWKQTDPVPTVPVATDITQITYAYNTGNWVYGAVYNWKLVAKNNYCETPGPVQSFTLRELPDLVVQNVQPPNMPFSGQSIEVSWEVHNTGLGSTGMTTWYDNVYLSTDNIYQPGTDTYLGGFANFTALNGLESYPQMKDVTLPIGIQGTYYIIVVTDAYNHVIEGNNDNNVSVAVSMMVNLTPPPDLVVQSTITPNNAFSGTNINVTWTVENQGTGNVPTGNYFYDYLYISDDPVYDPANATYLGRYYSAPIAVNATHTRMKSVMIPNYIFGDRYIHIVTDRLNDVFEYVFENNNTATSNMISITLNPPPDLIAHSLAVPDTLANKQQFTLQWVVENQGLNPAPGGFTDRAYVSRHFPFHPDSVSTLASFSYSGTLGTGASVNRSGNVTIPANYTGEYYFYVKTDVNDNIFEYVNENNNVSNAESAIVLNADLLITNVTVVDTTYSGENLTVNWTVKNNGLGNLVATSRTDRIYYSTNPVYNSASATLAGSLSYNNALAPGESLARQQTVSMPNGVSGKYYLHLLTDAGNDVFENTNETNNGRKDSTYVKLSPWADLRVDTITGLPDSTIAGNLLTLNYVAHNYGTKAVEGISGGWYDRVFISANPVWNPANAVQLHSINVLQSVPTGGTYNKSWSFNIPMLPAMLPTGICYIYVFSDHTDKIYEYTDEGNNVKRSNPIYVTAPVPVDFEVTAATLLQDTLSTGQTVNLQWSIKNIGNTTALWNYALWYDGVYLSLDTIYDEYSDIFVKDFTKQGPVVNGQTYSNNQFFNIPQGLNGNYYAFLVADHAEYTNDGNFGNNVWRLGTATGGGGGSGPAPVITIQQVPTPDLKANALVAPTSGISGQPIQLIWTVTNNGPGTTSGSWNDKFYLSTDFNISGNDLTIGSKTQTRMLATGQSYTDTLNAFLPISANGNYVLIFKTDANNAIFELDGETDNEFFSYLTATLPMPSDLMVDSISFPTMAMVGEPFPVTFSVKNNGVNPATGVMRDIIYFSADSVFDAMDVPYLGPLQRNINLAPQARLSGNFSNTTPGVPLGDYFIIVQTDALNNIYESSELNNVTISTQKVMVTVQELPLGVLTPDTLLNNKNLYYRIEIPDTLGGETMLVTLDGNTPQGINELYLSHGAVPTRSVHQFSFPNAFATDQEIVVPEILAGQYYLLAYGSTNDVAANGQQFIDLKAEIIPFEIRSVDDVKGGNTGNVTVRLDGAKFTPTMEVRLEDATLGTIVAHTITFINSTRVFATFNLAGASLGHYDVVAEKTPEIASLADAFEVVAGGAGTTVGTGGGGAGGFFCNIVNVGTDQNLAQNIAHPASIRVNRVATITIQFGNSGNVDIPCPARWLISLRGAPLGFTVDELEENKQELHLNFQEAGGPPGILRPGSFSSITVYAYSSHPMRFVLRE